MEKRSRSLAFILVLAGIVVLALGAVALANGLPPGGTFTDDDGNVHEGNIEAIAAKGITRGCNPAEGNTKYCPSSDLNRGQMAAFIRRALTLPASTTDYFIDDNDSVFEGDINALAEAGITKGCNPSEGNTKFCPEGRVRREVMAAFLRRAFNYPASSTDFFTDDVGSVFEADINAVALAGVTKGCSSTDKDLYCPQNLVRRDQMASFFARALNLAPIVPPPPTTTTTTVPSSVLQEGSGSGDSVVRVNIPYERAVVEFTHNGSANFIVWSRDNSLETIDLLVNEIGPYGGTRPIQFPGWFAEDSVRYLDISADGNWTYQIRRLADEPKQRCAVNGSGDSVVVISDFQSSARIAQLSHVGPANFIVLAYSTNDADLVVNEIGNYSGSKAIASGHSAWDIVAHGGTWKVDC